MVNFSDSNCDDPAYGGTATHPRRLDIIARYVRYDIGGCYRQRHKETDVYG